MTGRIARTYRESSNRISLSDLELEGMHFASTVRSPISRGSLKALEPPSFPRGYSLIQSNDIPGDNSILSFGTTIPVLSAERISYRGEPLALVTGPDHAMADELATRVKVRCEEEEPMLGWETFSSAQVVAKRVVTIGDPETAFAKAAHTYMGVYKTEAVEHYYSEPMGALAHNDYDKMAVYCATQWPYHVRDCVANALALKKDEVVVRPTMLGVHLDGKLWYPSLVSCHAAIASLSCGHPVKILYTREEDFLYTPKRARSSVSISSAVDASGAITALNIHLSVNVGAHAPIAEEILSQTILAATGVYRCENVRIEGYAVTTNTPPLGALGGLGSSHSFFALETHVNRIARDIGENPLEWKARNLIGKKHGFMGGDTLRENPPYEEISRRLAEKSDFRRKYASYELIRKSRSHHCGDIMRGIGMSFAYQGGVFFLKGDSPNSYTIEATLDKNLILTLGTSAAVAGESVLHQWRSSAAAILGISPESVIFTNPSTDSVPNSGPTTMSRTVVIEHLVERCCRVIQRRRFRDPLPITARCMHRMSNPLSWKDGRLSGSPFDAASWGGSIVEVEIDPWTMQIRPVGIWVVAEGKGAVADKASEAGERIISGLRATVIDALGSCMREYLDPADLKPEAFFRYAQLLPAELPPISVEVLESRKKTVPKGFDEIPFDTIPAAFLSAVSQAAGADFFRLPVRNQDIVRSMEAP